MSFNTTFGDGETLYWEAKTVVEASTCSDKMQRLLCLIDEIVATLRYLIKLCAVEKKFLKSSGQNKRATPLSPFFEKLGLL